MVKAMISQWDYRTTKAVVKPLALIGMVAVTGLVPFNRQASYCEGWPQTQADHADMMAAWSVGYGWSPVVSLRDPHLCEAIIL
jgi:hypothetical protein